MIDDLKQRGLPDLSRVNVNEAYQVKYWTLRFGCTEEQLKQASSQVGPSAAAIRVLLRG